MLLTWGTVVANRWSLDALLFQPSYTSRDRASDLCTKRTVLLALCLSLATQSSLLSSAVDDVLAAVPACARRIPARPHAVCTLRGNAPSSRWVAANSAHQRLKFHNQSISASESVLPVGGPSVVAAAAAADVRCCQQRGRATRNEYIQRVTLGIAPASQLAGNKMV